MRVGLLSPQISINPIDNQREVLLLAEKAVAQGAEFIILPEAVVTGLTNTGYPEYDYTLTESLLGPITSQWQEFAYANGVYFAAGFLERDRDLIYDSAVLFNPKGAIALHYRRIDPGWIRKNDNPEIYRMGNEINTSETALGRIAFLICGDLWNDAVRHKLLLMKPDVVLYLFARAFTFSKKGTHNWEYELSVYTKRWASLKANVIAVNLLGDGTRDTSIGGAWTLRRNKPLQEVIPVLHSGFSVIDI